MKLKILIADDQELNRLLLSRLVSQLGHTALLATNGREAIEIFQAEKPDLILLDLVMPEMNGIEVTLAIRAMPQSVWVPIIIQSASTEQDNIIKGLKAGADDYITKPFQVDILHAKLRNFELSISAQRQLEAQNVELRHYHFETEDEKRVASHLMQSLIDVNRLQTQGLQWWVQAADTFSGDILAAAATPAGIQHLMLADGTGHGLPAALSAQPLPDIFYAMTAKGCSIGSIAQEINRRIGRLLPIDRFFSTTVVAIDPREQMIEVWNGGNPALLVLDAEGKVEHVFKSQHLPLGIIRQRDCSAETERFAYKPDQQLFAMSDGLLEAFMDQSPTDGMHQIIALMSENIPSERLTALKRGVDKCLAGKHAHDDISLMLIDLDQLVKSLPAHTYQSAGVHSDEAWGLSLSLNGGHLRQMNQEVVPFMMGALERLSKFEQQRGSVFVVLSELYNNALDHGLLRLDSKLKNMPDGFESYLSARQERLASLGNDAKLDLVIEMQSGSAMCITVKDSGAGFDYSKVISVLENNHQHHGRGFALIRAMGATLEFLGNGNEVRAVIGLNS